MNFITAIFVTLAVMRAGFYFHETKKSGRKRSFKDFFKATYTEEDLEELKQQLCKEMKIKESANEATFRC